MNYHVRTVLDRLEGVRSASRGWKAKCPAHDDSNPSLSIAEGNREPVVLNCHAGCKAEDVLYALNLTWGDIRKAESDLKQSVKRKEKESPKPRPKCLSDAEAAERMRAYRVMLPAELQLYDEYLRKRTQASARRERDEMEHWDGKIRDLFDQVIRREKRLHYNIDKMDTNYE